MSFDPNSLAQAGILGIILAWFMLRLEGILQKNTDAWMENTKTQQKLIDVIARLCEDHEKS